MSNEKFGVWEQPKDGSANGCWSSNGESSIHTFGSMAEAASRAHTWNNTSAHKHLHHEARELPEAWWSLSAEEIFNLISK